jgi:hypothetical protein
VLLQVLVRLQFPSSPSFPPRIPHPPHARTRSFAQKILHDILLGVLVWPRAQSDPVAGRGGGVLCTLSAVVNPSLLAIIIIYPHSLTLTHSPRELRRGENYCGMFE